MTLKLPATGESLAKRIKSATNLCIIHFDTFYNYRKKSADALADALHVVFSLVESVRDSQEDIAEIDRVLLKERKVTVQSNTSLELKCIKLTYDFTRESEDRLRKWARVLIAAHQQGQDTNSFKRWLKDVGGIKAAAELATSGHTVIEGNPEPKDSDAGSGAAASGNPTEDISEEATEELEPDEGSVGNSARNGEEPLGNGKLIEMPEIIVPGTYVQVVSMNADGTFEVTRSTNDPKIIDYVRSKLASNDNKSENEKRALAQSTSVGG